jgi:N,N-dimethylformamidase
MVDWLEAKSFEYEVITDHDLHREGLEILKPYRTVITGSHPEYVSEQMLDSLEEYLMQGGRLMYLGGNGFYWVTSVSPDEPRFLEIRRWGGSQGWEAPPGEYYHSTTGEMGGLWRFRGRPPQQLVGVGFASQGFDRNAPYERLPASLESRYSFIFEGVGADEMIGDFPSLGMGPGAAGDEVDRLEYGLGTRPGVEALARSKGLTDGYLLVVEDLLQSRPNLGGTVHPNVRADIVYFKYPAEGAVFSVGSISWFECLSANDYSNNVSRITENVLREFSTAETLP